MVGDLEQDRLGWKKAEMIVVEQREEPRGGVAFAGSDAAELTAADSVGGRDQAIEREGGLCGGAMLACELR